MKKILIALCFTATFAYAQDTVTIHHQRYSTTFDTVLHYPILVHWIVKTSDICDKKNKGRVERKSASFKPDPLLKKATNLQKYYSKNAGGYQRGHNMNAADNSCNITQMKESFYFSNMTPQTKELNEIVWGDLEDDTRKLVKQYGKVEVWCGSYAFKEKMGAVTVPLFCWKILKYNGHEVAYIFPNHHEVNNHPYTFYRSSVNSIRSAAHLPLTDIHDIN